MFRLLPAERIAKILDGKIGHILHLKKEDVISLVIGLTSEGK